MSDTLQKYEIRLKNTIIYIFAYNYGIKDGVLYFSNSHQAHNIGLFFMAVKEWIYVKEVENKPIHTQNEAP